MKSADQEKDLFIEFGKLYKLKDLDCYEINRHHIYETPSLVGYVHYQPSNPIENINKTNLSIHLKLKASQIIIPIGYDDYKGFSINKILRTEKLIRILTIDSIGYLWPFYLNEYNFEKLS